jgi:hypothetical protein
MIPAGYSLHDVAQGLLEASLHAYFIISFLLSSSKW